MKNILVVFGGISPESDISVLTGVTVVNAMRGTEFNPVPVYVSKTGEWFGGSVDDLDCFKTGSFKEKYPVTLLNGSPWLYKIKRNKLKPLFLLSGVLNCCHGGTGEGGGLSGMINGTGIPLLSPSVLPSSVAMDKIKTKEFLKGNGVKTAKYFIATDCDAEKYQSLFNEMKPVIIKPNKLGSSIGITVADNFEDFSSGLKTAINYDGEVLIEEFLSSAKEINCSAYFDGEKVVVSECESPVKKGNFLSFADKYSFGEREFPAKVDKKISDKIKGITLKVYSLLSFTGVIRIDYLVKDNKIYLNEINSVPGTLALYLYGDPLSYGETLSKIIKGGLIKYNRESQIIKNVDTDLFRVSAKGDKIK